MPDTIVLSAELDARLVAELRTLAESEGRQVASVIEQALTEFLDRRQQPQARPHVLEKYRESLATFGPLYERLAR